MDNAKIIKRLEKPKRKVDVVLDTDTYNEIDDQFALAYLIQSEEKLNLKAVYAAPFLNHHSESPEDGMQRSYQELFNCYKLMNETRYHEVTFRGSTQFLKDEQTPEESDAVRDLIDRSKNYSEENPLYVIGIAAATNLASAILLDPTIINRIVILWLGGLSYDWHDNKSFNSGQDVAAARVLLDSGVPLVQFPGKNVISAFTTTGPELEYWLKGKNKFCDYMIEKTAEEARICYGGSVWSRAIWDVVPVAWLLDGEFMLDTLIKSPIMQYNDYYSFDSRRHFIKYVYRIERDNLMDDLFTKLSKIPS
ncbi:nucleoside hydrolase [Enterococcus sp. BWB1-3]|uniref:nucleoside hydrolase n=1 Tax=Enterococcus sp. BWB1-3 TaxID=2787713 RepID=UPI0019214CC3|nr:nucleoside hydrolase [Enterococcus sp. BWB1-3]MBL1227809.1 nucleoside hydrolase [Enterococcus sp. BWB1-3]